MNSPVNFMNGMFGKIGAGLCRMSMDGKIAIKTSNGYKTYDVATNQLMNCDNFVFDIGQDFFFMIPTNQVAVGDIIMVGGKPVTVIKAEDNMITVLRYEDSSIQTIVPERHMFMGQTYFYGKIVSMFGNLMGNTNDPNQMMKYMMMSQMMSGNGNNGMGNMMPMMFMMNGGFDSMFNGMFAPAVAPAPAVKTPAVAPAVKDEEVL